MKYMQGPMITPEQYNVNTAATLVLQSNPTVLLRKNAHNNGTVVTNTTTVIRNTVNKNLRSRLSVTIC